MFRRQIKIVKNFQNAFIFILIEAITYPKEKTITIFFLFLAKPYNKTLDKIMLANSSALFAMFAEAVAIVRSANTCATQSCLMLSDVS